MPDAITWHRPEYRDRGDELISLAQVADLASVTRAAVPNWRRRHDFPAPAMTAGRTVWVVRNEAETWLSTQRTPNKPATKSSAHLIRRVAALEAREQKQAAALADTRKQLRAARQELAANN